MRRLLSTLLLLLLLLILGAVPLQAQEESDLEWLTVDLWPDFDRPAMLVLLTGAVAPGASLPASVTIPLPEGVDLNAVARITDADEMIDDIQFTETEGGITLTTPDRRFRVEYYAPYTADDLQRSYTFNWLAPETVPDLSVSVQQPAAASSVQIDPQAANVITGLYGLQYHTLPPVSVAAGEPYLVDIDYTLTSNQLTTTMLPDDQTGSAADVTTPIEDNGPNWPVVLAVLGGAVLAVAVAWHLWGDRLTTGRAGPRKPQPSRSARGPQRARFCHNCGQQAGPDDKFCRNCGTELKNR